MDKYLLTAFVGFMYDIEKFDYPRERPHSIVWMSSPFYKLSILRQNGETKIFYLSRGKVWFSKIIFLFMLSISIFYNFIPCIVEYGGFFVFLSQVYKTFAGNCQYTTFILPY